MTKKKKSSFSKTPPRFMFYLSVLVLYALFHGIMFLSLGPAYITSLGYPIHWVANKLYLSQFVTVNFITEFWYTFPAIVIIFLVVTNSTIMQTFDKIDERLIQIKDKFDEGVTSIKKSFKKKINNLIPSTFLRKPETSNMDDSNKATFLNVNYLNFQYAVEHGFEDQIDQMLKVLPNETLYTFMQKENDTGKTLLACALYGSKSNLSIFKKIFNAIEPQKRLSLLTKEINVQNPFGKKPRRLPLIYLFEHPYHIPFLKSILDLLQPKECEQLIYKKTNIGDNLFHHIASLPISGQLFNLYSSYLSKEQIKTVLTECCPHGYTPLMKRIKIGNIDDVKEFFDSIPEEIRKDVINFKAASWTMLHGEKLLWMAQDESLVETSITQYLKQNFNLTYSEEYRSLDHEQLRNDLVAMIENRKKNSCIKRDRFLKQHGKLPETLLGVEIDSRPTVYMSAFRKLMLKHHPDKNQNIDDGMSSKITSAKQFISDINFRKKKHIIRNS